MLISPHERSPFIGIRMIMLMDTISSACLMAIVICLISHIQHEANIVKSPKGRFCVLSRDPFPNQRWKTIPRDVPNRYYSYTAPPKTQNLQVQLNNSEFKLHWDASPGAVRYDILFECNGNLLAKMETQRNECEFSYKEI